MIWDWNEAVGKERNNIVVKTPEFFHKLNDFFGKRSAKSLIPYLRWHLTYNLSPLLGHEFLEATLKVDANLMGISKQPERWHKCVAATKSALPTTAEKLFVENFFSEDDRQVALTMLDFIRDAFKQNLEVVPWMSEESRTAALEKLHNIFFECGHPTAWEPDDWVVSPTSYFNNSLVSCEAKKKRKLARLLEPAHRRRWSMSIMSVNSYYDNAVNGLFISTRAFPSYVCSYVCSWLSFSVSAVTSKSDPVCFFWPFFLCRSLSHIPRAPSLARALTRARPLFPVPLPDSLPLSIPLHVRSGGDAAKAVLQQCLRHGAQFRGGGGHHGARADTWVRQHGAQIRPGKSPSRLVG
jgi:hypothetical protein